jgi:hypothetical protein
MNSIFRRRFRRPTRRELQGLASESQSKQSDSSHAIDLGTGNEIWKRSLNTPVAQSSLPCDNIDPLGVTGTPVINESTDAIARIHIRPTTSDCSRPAVGAFSGLYIAPRQNSGRVVTCP